MINVENLKNQLDLTAIVQSEGTELSDGRGLCPFHADRNPSLKLWPESQTCKCFACNRGGDVIDFIMDLHHFNFKQAVKYLQDKYLNGHTVTIKQKSYTLVNPETLLLDTEISVDKNFIALIKQAEDIYSKQLFDLRRQVDIGLINPARYYTLSHYYEDILENLQSEKYSLEKDIKLNKKKRHTKWAHQQQQQ